MFMFTFMSFQCSHTSFVVASSVDWLDRPLHARASVF